MHMAYISICFNAFIVLAVLSGALTDTGLVPKQGIYLIKGNGTPVELDQNQNQNSVYLVCRYIIQVQYRSNMNKRKCTHVGA